MSGGALVKDVAASAVGRPRRAATRTAIARRVASSSGSTAGSSSCELSCREKVSCRREVDGVGGWLVLDGVRFGGMPKRGTVGLCGKVEKAGGRQHASTTPRL